MTKTGITITVRMKSTRLPLKAMRYIHGKPMIEHMIDRLKQSEKADEIVLCTSVDDQDDILIDVAKKKDIQFFRGRREDVLQRLKNAADEYDLDFIVSTTGDNPLTSARYIDRMIEDHHEHKSDYVTAKDLPIGTYAHGVSKKGMKKVIEDKKKADTEIWGHLFEEHDEIKWSKLDISNELSNTEIRLTVDKEPDLILIRSLFDKFGPKNEFKIEDAVDYLNENPSIKATNSEVDHWTNEDS